MPGKFRLFNVTSPRTECCTLRWDLLEGNTAIQPSPVGNVINEDVTARQCDEKKKREEEEEKTEFDRVDCK